MPIPFQRSTRALAQESDERSALTLLFTFAVVAAITVWSFHARVTVFETTETARVEALSGVHLVQAEVAGRVVSTLVTLDREVRAGDVLIELDARKERLELDEERAKIAGYVEELSAIDRERDAAARALLAFQNEHPLALREAQLRRQESELHATFAEQDSARLGHAGTGSGLSERELARARSDALERRALARASSASVRKLAATSSRLLSERRAALAGLDRDHAQTSASLASARARAAVLERVISLRTIRAPVAGRLAQVYELPVGAVLEQGTRVAAVVPAGELRVVAHFPTASTLGRVSAGQRAWLRLDGFVWTEYGKTEARVEHVSSEALDGKVRVELSVPHPPPYLAHGLAASVEVEVERLAPAGLITRMATRRWTGLANRTTRVD